MESFENVLGAAPCELNGYEIWEVLNAQERIEAIPVGWIIDRANDPERAPLYRRYAQMLYEEWQKEQVTKT
jgi:hypothetical protein